MSLVSHALVVSSVYVKSLCLLTLPCALGLKVSYGYIWHSVRSSVFPAEAGFRLVTELAESAIHTHNATGKKPRTFKKRPLKGFFWWRWRGAHAPFFEIWIRAALRVVVATAATSLTSDASPLKLKWKTSTPETDSVGLSVRPTPTGRMKWLKQTPCWDPLQST